MEIPWDRLTMLVLGLAVIICVTVLASQGVAEWNDVFTIFLVVLAGIGFSVAGYYYGRTEGYRELLRKIGWEDKKHG